jgi:hypothetical protein
MISALTELELRLLDRMDREQLIAALGRARHWLLVEISDEWLSEQSTERLRILLLAAKLLRVLRQRETMNGSH